MAFSEAGVPLALCGAQTVDTVTGVASCSICYGSIGGHTVVAAYLGNAAFKASASSPLTQVVEVDDTFFADNFEAQFQRTIAQSSKDLDYQLTKAL